MASSPARAVSDQAPARVPVALPADLPADLAASLVADLGAGDAAATSSLATALTTVPEARHRRGRRHELTGMLAIALSPGMLLVVDNVGAHQPERIRELVAAAGCELVFLPAYSPDLSPIEEAFSKIKALV